MKRQEDSELNKLTTSKIQSLIWTIFALSVILSFLTGFHELKINNFEMKMSEFPEKYVQLDRYQIDQNRSEQSIIRIERKLDQLILLANPRRSIGP